MIIISWIKKLINIGIIIIITCNIKYIKYLVYSTNIFYFIRLTDISGSQQFFYTKF